MGDGAKHVQRRYENDVQEVQVGWYMYMHQLKVYHVAFPYFHYAPLTFNLEKLHGNPLNDKVGASRKD
jgi:hypothetical protein